MRLRPGLTRFIALAATSTLLTSVAACGSTGKGTEPTSSASPTSASPSDSTTKPQVAALEGVQFTVPGDWTIEKGGSSLILQPPKSTGDGVRPGSGSFRSSSSLAYEDELDEMAEVGLGSLKSYDRAERLPDVKLGGVTFYHLQAEDDATWVDSFVAIHNGRQFGIRWLFTHIIDRNQATALINQVMPTFKPTS